MSVNTSVRAWGREHACGTCQYERVCARQHGAVTLAGHHAPGRPGGLSVPSPRSMTWLSPQPQPTPQGQASLRRVPEQRLGPQGHCRAARSTGRSSNAPRTPRSPRLARVTDCVLASPVAQTHTWLHLTLASRHRNNRWGAAGAGPASQLTWRTGPWGGGGQTTDRQTDSRSSETSTRQRKVNDHTCPRPGDHMGPSACPTWAED